MGDGSDAGRIELVASYTPDGLRDMVRTAYSHLRSRGAAPAAAAGDAPAAPGGRGAAPRGRRRGQRSRSWPWRAGA